MNIISRIVADLRIISEFFNSRAVYKTYAIFIGETFIFEKRRIDEFANIRENLVLSNISEFTGNKCSKYFQKQKQNKALW